MPRRGRWRLRRASNESKARARTARLGRDQNAGGPSAAASNMTVTVPQQKSRFDRDQASYSMAGRRAMLERSTKCAVGVALAAALTMTASGVQAFDDAKYPNWQGQWTRVIVPGVGGQ